MTTPQPALLVIDMQNGFINHHSSHIVPTVHRLVASWPGDVVFTRFVNPPDSAYERLIGWRRMRESPETDLVPDLAHLAKVVIDKQVYSFFNAAGRALAHERGWKTVAICGVATDGCVLKTAIDAFEAGVVPFIVKDACASHAGTEAQEAGLFLAARFIGRGATRHCRGGAPHSGLPYSCLKQGPVRQSAPGVVRCPCTI